MKKTSLFISVLFAALAAPLLADWVACSIGPASEVTIDNASANNFKLTSTGAQLSNSRSDSIGFVSGPAKLVGDCEVLAHVTKISASKGEWATGGVIMRESFGAGSKFVAIACTRTHGIRSYSRSQADAVTVEQENCIECNPPYWLRIVRQGDHFICFKSTDGKIWLDVDEVDVVMKKNVWVGVFSTSGGDQSAATISFERVFSRETPAQ